MPAQHYTGPASHEEVKALSTDSLREMISAYPYSAVFRSVLAARLKQADDPEFRDSLRHAALHAPDRNRLYHFLHTEPNALQSAVEEEVADVPEAAKKETISAPVPEEAQAIAEEPEAVPVAEHPGPVPEAEVSQEEAVAPAQEAVDTTSESIEAAAPPMVGPEEEKPLLAEVKEASEKKEKAAKSKARKEKDKKAKEKKAKEKKAKEAKAQKAKRKKEDEKALKKKNAKKAAKKKSVKKEKQTDQASPASLKSTLLQKAADKKVSLEEKHSFLEWLDILEDPKKGEDPPFDAGEQVLEERYAREAYASRLQLEVSQMEKEEAESADDPDDHPEVKSLASKSITLNTGLATETLAKIMLKQGKIKDAIAVYAALRLKYPEKSDYFAALIEDLKAE